MSIKIRLIKSAVLTIDGTEKHVTRIGSGRYTTAWKNGTGDVWLQTHEKDASKEILAYLTRYYPGNPHIPKVFEVGCFDGNSPFKLYRSPEYLPLTAKHTSAWHMFKALQACWNAARTNVIAKRPWNVRTSAALDAVDSKQEFLRLVGIALPDTLILKAIDAIVSESCNYNGYAIEITKKNTAVDEHGNLVLLDPLFDLCEVRGKQ